MLGKTTLLLGVLASTALAQITVTPSTIRTGRTTGIFPTITVTETETETETVTTTESYIRQETVAIPPITETVTLPPRTTTVISTAIISSTIIRTTTATRTQVSTTTQTVRQISTETATVTSTRVSTVSGACGGGGAACPTITSTATACRSCLVPQCTTTSVLTRPCGCSGALPTSVVSFPCSDPDSCNRIGCTTVYSVQTQRC